MMAPNDEAVLEARGVSGLGAGGETICAATARFAPGRLHILRGPPEGGRDWLLRILGLLALPERGEVLLGGQSTRALSEAARAELRSQRFGYVFAAPFLLTSFTVLENVAMPLFKVSHVTPEEARRRTDRALEFVGLSAVMESAVQELPLLSQHRAALARALINEPACVIVEDLAPVLGDADFAQFLELLARAAESRGLIALAAVPPACLPPGAPRVLEIADGAIIHDSLLLPEPGS